ncbi:WD40 repeat-like protein [Pseudovirgaria hyperparasitica]|uniref:WD40 repeat-like protein n=1 Tax=Pseudovirgaria hyperparasitica TaxID=470096 RepID=A0A6A6WLN4_9PEZI|nr:WD40 repeat-like protein [Pseudovirgaria hyperparasitica]KAF2763056.1 WD40 repeat-like protein [Pseudovirgaria hyperparasitica]
MEREKPHQRRATRQAGGDEADVLDSINDPIKDKLEAVNLKLCRPAFLQSISASRLPSQAASDCSSISPEPTKSTFGFQASKRTQSNLSDTAVEFASRVERIEAAHILTIDLLSHGSAAALTLNHKVCQKLQASVLRAYKAAKSMATDRGFQSFSHGHQDLVLAVDFNYFGTRMVTASSDHRLKVWDRKDDNWNLADSWRAHDAEIVDVKWNGPYAGEILGSVAEDGRFKLWQEDVTEVPQSGRRFKLVTTLTPETKVPYMSLDFKNIFQDTYLALITRDGHLSVYEPLDNNNIAEWQYLHDSYVCATPSRQDEAGFKVCFHHEKLPCWTAVREGLDRKSLSLAVAAMKTVKIFRTDKNRKWYVAAELNDATSIVRDLSWANGSMRGYDIIATASKDGAIRIYELHNAETDKQSASDTTVAIHNGHTDGRSSPRPRGSRAGPSGIGAGLAGASKSNEDSQEVTIPGRVKHLVKKVAELKNHHGAVWRVAFSPMGDLLISTGDDGTIRTWKKGVNDLWKEYSEIDGANED